MRRILVAHSHFQSGLKIVKTVGDVGRSDHTQAAVSAAAGGNETIGYRDIITTAFVLLQEKWDNNTTFYDGCMNTEPSLRMMRATTRIDARIGVCQRCTDEGDSRMSDVALSRRI